MQKRKIISILLAFVVLSLAVTAISQVTILPVHVDTQPMAVSSSGNTLQLDVKNADDVQPSSVPAAAPVKRSISKEMTPRTGHVIQVQSAPATVIPTIAPQPKIIDLGQIAGQPKDIETNDNAPVQSFQSLDDVCGFCGFSSSDCVAFKEQVAERRR
ncbi:hypothetical protein HZB00_01290 [Candidatus Woesearchaeota archaeon]|nr:hypothetical protein [Candidatus Woesearchaeota archaeon]